jgi:hypothetical protein
VPDVEPLPDPLVALPLPEVVPLPVVPLVELSLPEVPVELGDFVTLVRM